MKIKYDFVTNSSTCSFIMIGFKVPIDDDDDNEYDKLRDKMDEVIKKFGDIFSIHFGLEGGAPDDNTALIGRDLITMDEYTAFTELNFKNIDDVIELAKSFNVEKEDIKYMAGSMMC